MYSNFLNIQESKDFKQMKRQVLAILLFLTAQFSFAQVGNREPLMHSHNDYHQRAPFWLAYNAGAKSIEIDVFLKNNELYVAHSKAEIKKDRTIQSLYFNPLQQLANDYRSIQNIQFLVDIKTEATTTLNKLAEIMTDYPLLFNDSPQSVKLVISGNRPAQESYGNYPAYILFDGRNPSEALFPGGEKIAIISRNFSDFSHWKGNSNISKKDSVQLQKFIDECHSTKKPVRFWNTADNEQVHQTLLNLGADFINTDDPFRVKAFLDKLDTGKELPAWQEGFLDIHHISTGRGNATFMVFPDGTTMVVDMGDMSETHSRTLSERNTPALPNASKTPAKWVANYIKQFGPGKEKIDYALITHYHDDHFGEIDSLRKKHTEGDYLLTGITELGSILSIGKLMDRGFEFPVNLKDTVIQEKYHLKNDAYSMIGTLQEYWKFIDFQKEKNKMVYETFKAGSDTQIQLKESSDYPTFKVQNLFVNGGAIDKNRNTIALFSEGEYPGENDLCTGIRISYGKFDYYTGGDISGIDGLGQENPNSPETVYAPIIGPVDVATLNHHGNRNSQNPFYVSQIKPRVWIDQVWSSDHPGENVLRRITSTQLYPGPRDLYATSMLEANELVIGGRIRNSFQSLHGHVVVRVYPGGDKYSVYVLNDRTTERKVISEHDYQSR